MLIDAFDENGHCSLWNKQCRKTFGWTIDEINAFDDTLAVFYPDPAVRDKVMRTVTTEPDGRFREWHPVTKDGKTLTTMWANFSLPDGLTFNLGYDATERKQAEAELEKHREHLEEIVRERTADLQDIINSMAGREVRMAGLKKVIKKLRTQVEEAGMTPVADDPLKEMSGQ